MNYTFSPDTIAAIITPPGRGAVSAIRLSGEKAAPIANALFSGDLLEAESHKALYGALVSPKTKGIIDQALILVMKGPNSYTGEDVVEIFCHGSPIITEEIVEELCALGARPAKGGEFTLRAFQNGKIDLVQAEAVQSAIAADNALSMKLAARHLEVALSKKIQSWQKELTAITAIFEAAVDFPEEGLSFAKEEEIQPRLQTVLHEMQTLLDSFSDGKKLEEGLSCCLIGSPNAGKSSLLNALLRKDRAIVTKEAGTTRDLLEETLKIGPYSFSLIDTAGIRKAENIVEKEGILRSKKAAKDADFILLVIDSSKPLDPETLLLMEKADPEKTLLVWNKKDLGKDPYQQGKNGSFPTFPHQIALSAKTAEGVEELKKRLETLLWNAPPENYSLMLSKKRHKSCLEKAAQYVQTVADGLCTLPAFELFAIDLKEALHLLSNMIGSNVTEDVLSSIFSQFCVGK